MHRIHCYQVLSTEEIYLCHSNKGQQTRDKDRRLSTRGDGEGTRERRKEYLSKRIKELPLNMGETDGTQHPMAVYKGKGEKTVLG